MGEQKQSLNPSQRAMLFAQATRQYLQEQPSRKFIEGETLRFDLPKTRFLSKIFLMLKGTFKATHSSKTTFSKAPFDKYNLLRQVRVEINNGFNPYQLSGQSLFLYNMVNNFKTNGVDNFGIDALENFVSSAGQSNKISLVLELPLTLNDRDAVGLILLQNDETNVSLEIDCDYIKKIMVDSDIDIKNVDITVTPVLETFSIPRIPDAIPDYSIIKLVNQQVENIVGSGETTIKLPTGLTYRKLIVYLDDGTGNPITPDKVKDFQLIFNQGDRPYSISGNFLAYKNRKDYGGTLPQGCYVLDFSLQGLANLGGGRDYIDTERLTEFWLKVNTTANEGTVYTIGEKLAKMV